MTEIEEIDELYDEFREFIYGKPKPKNKISAYFEQKDQERENKRIKKKGLYGRILTLKYLRSVLEEFEEKIGYLPILHENLFLSKEELNFGPFAEDKKVTSTLYFEPSPYWNGEFVCHDDTGDSIGWTRMGFCTATRTYNAVIQNNYGSKAEEVVRKQLADGVDIAIDKFMEAGRSCFEKIKEQNLEGNI